MRPGDSGTVWHLRQEYEGQPAAYRPLAAEWGAQTIDLQGNLYNFALATNLSNICKLLDVELVAEPNAAARPYWGATGHYSIGRVAVEEVEDKKPSRWRRRRTTPATLPRPGWWPITGRTPPGSWRWGYGTSSTYGKAHGRPAGAGPRIRRTWSDSARRICASATPTENSCHRSI
ncbi:hypothetical protein [Pigmentiphaga soli]|uniref:hypothetical protein n=1 Tax=Pigmentiphaga soli TaxID=1007095 RepID=UPI0031EE2D3D